MRLRGTLGFVGHFDDYPMTGIGGIIVVS